MRPILNEIEWLCTVKTDRSWSPETFPINSGGKMHFFTGELVCEDFPIIPLLRTVYTHKSTNTV